MRQTIFSEGMTDDQKISILEHVVLRLTRRAKKVSQAMISPIPISASVIGENISGCIMKGILLKGRITKAAIGLGERPNDEVWIDIRVGESGKTYKLSNQKEVVDLNLSVEDGDEFEVSVSSTNGAITEVLISFLWVPDSPNIDVQNFLISKLEEDSNALIKID